MTKSRWRRRSKPCSVCRRWFKPDARVGARQRTCGAPECRRKQKQRTQARWSKRNPSYWSKQRLWDRAQALNDAETEVEFTGPPPGMSGLPTTWAQDVMGAEALVITVFLGRLVYRAAQAAMRRQRMEITKEIRGYRRDRPQDEIGNGGPAP